MKLAFIIGYGASAIGLLSRLLAEEAAEHGFDYLVVGDKACSEHADFIRDANAILVYSSGLPGEVEKAVRHGRAKLVLALSVPCAHLARGSPDVISRAWAFYKTGGEKNLRALIHLMLKELGVPVEVPELEEVPWQGILHPELGSFSSTEDYLRAYSRAGRPLVGLLFYRSQAIYGQLGHVRALVKALEDEGLGVLPVFTYGFRDAMLDTPTAEDTIREFFFVNKKPVVDAVVDLTSFFLLDHGRWDGDASSRFNVASGIELLKELGVPVISAVVSFNQSVGEWLKDKRGVDYLTQVYRVIMPEVDGLIEPIFVAGSRVGPEGAKSYEPFEEHARYLARRVKKWIELKRKRPEERRIAIILINPPCKGLEASLAVGFGLDVPESVVRLLHRLKELGYDVGDHLPRDGQELVRVFMEKKAISEFRWTSVEAIVESGGAAAFVDAETYMSWFEELPRDVREKMVADWGHPLDVLSGRAPKELAGMVYDGKFVVPGLFFGNIFITPQPKCGCAGPACDGRVCRILHDPTVSPPHQWLAVYRWITRVFKADVVIHFGTHGTLEFRPGKGVGLSPSCWPEITIDDVPHLYVYVVSNPMEGVIAKRRSYAVLVDHMYPPMARAGVLDELDALLAQYARARQLGEVARAQAIYEQLLRAAKENNIPLRGRGPEEVVEEIHRYVSAVRNTQVEAGLHVFGHPPEDPSVLAEHVATVMAFDSHYCRSIRRVIAECLGLDYDELREKPGELNVLGFTNGKTLDLLHKLAVHVIKRLLDKHLEPSQLTPEVALELLEEGLREVLGNWRACSS